MLMMRKYLIVVTLLFISNSLLAQDLCIGYFAQKKIEIRSEMTKEERREAEIYNLEIRLTYDNSPLSVKDLQQIQRAKKWLQNRSTYHQNQLINARYEAAVHEIYAHTLQLCASRDPLSEPALKEVLSSIKWFKENGTEVQFTALKDAFTRGQANSFRNIDSILKKSISKLNKSDTRELFKYLDIAIRLELKQLEVEIREKLASLTKVVLETAFLYFDFGRQPKSTIKHNNDQHLATEYARHLLEIGKDYVNSGNVISTSVGSTIVGFRARRFSFRGTAYRIIYSRLDNGKIYVEFMGTHEEYNMFFK